MMVAAVVKAQKLDDAHAWFRQRRLVKSSSITRSLRHWKTEASPHAWLVAEEYVELRATPSLFATKWDVYC